VSKVIGESGNPQSWKAVYWRHLQRYEHEADSLDAALRFLEYGEDEGSLSAESVLGPAGEVVVAEDEIFDATFGYGHWAKDVRAQTIRAIEAGGS
jgi:hypothetical protein